MRTIESLFMAIMVASLVAACGSRIVGFQEGRPCETDADCGGGVCAGGFCTALNEAPVVNVVSPLDGSSVASGTSVTVHAIIRDADDDDETLVVTVVSSLDQLLLSGSPAASGIFSFDQVLSDGEHTLHFTAVDPKGAEGSATITFTVTGGSGDTDADGDGYTPNQGDCDDNPATGTLVNPGASESCNGVDDDCDSSTDEDLSFDDDGDGFYATGSCQSPADDCDDSLATGTDVFPGATELCDGKDNDCDGSTDEGLSTDDDGDGHYTTGSCLTPNDDCDDSLATGTDVFPGASELCDGKDNDCVSGNETGEVDADGDGYLACAECDDDPATGTGVNPGATETCNGVDDDCDSSTDEGLSTDDDGDGHYTSGSCLTPNDDCDDTLATGADVFPGAPELCDGKDNDCVSGNETGELDADGDGYLACDDCDDDPATGLLINSGATEICNGVDDDCDTSTDEGLSTDLDGDGHFTSGSCATPADDCDDSLATGADVFPGAPELCDGKDNDCVNGNEIGEVDADGDGYFVCEGDCDDDPATGGGINPGAAEVCDTIDNDCSGLPDDIAGCNYCGNGLLDGTEQCDDPAGNSDTLADACRTDCTDARCGDDVVDFGEVCDDGGTAIGDGCDANCQPEPCTLSGTRTGTITAAMSPCVVVSDTTVPLGQTLTVEAGVVFKFQGGRDWNTNDADLIVAGTLNLDGTVAAPIIFTSYQDDSVAGDTNGDATATVPATGDWGRLILQSTASGRLSNLEMRWGGGNNANSCCTANPAAAAMITGSVAAMPPMTGVLVERSQAAGMILTVTGGFSTDFAGVTFRNNAGDGLRLSAGNAQVTLDTVTASANAGDGVSITATAPVDALNGTFASNGGRGLRISTSGRVDVTGNTMTGQVASYGLDLNAATSNSTVRSNIINTNHTQVRTVPALTEEIVNNNTLTDTQRGIVLRSGNVNITTVWPDPGYVYQVEGDIIVDATRTLTLSPGVIFKLQSGRVWNTDDRDFIVRGFLDAQGTAADPIVFTSVHDDSAGGDTGIDGVGTLPNTGDWGELRFEVGSDGTLDYVEGRWGGGGNVNSCCTANPAANAILEVSAGSAPTMDHLTITNSQARGAWMNVSGGFTTEITNSTFNANATVGLEFSHGAGPVIATDVSAASNGGSGVRATAGGNVTFTRVTSNLNGGAGVYVSAPGTVTVDTVSSTNQSGAIGLEVPSAGPASTILDTLLTGNGRAARVAPNMLAPVLGPTNTLGGTANGILVVGGTLGASAAWNDPGFVLVVENDVTVPAGVVLDLGAGLVLKMIPRRIWNTDDGDLLVSGVLNINGVTGSPVVITSLNDDTAGGDTNLDGVASSPAPGDWRGVRYQAGSSGTVSFVDLRYGGGNNRNSCCTANPAGDAIFYSIVGIPVSDSSFSFSQSRGARLDGGVGSMSGGAFLNNATWGLSFNNATTCANWTQTGNTFSANGTGTIEGC